MKTLLIKILALSILISAHSFGQYKPNIQTKQVTSEQLMKAYKQGTVKFSSYRYGMTPGGGNCASVALIKSAIGNYGLYGVFQNVTIDTEKKEYNVYLKDGRKIDLSFDRYKMAADFFAYDDKRLGNDDTSKEILEYSKFCFAVMARVKQLNHVDEKRKESYFYVDVDDLNKGEGAAEIYELLGLPSFEITNFSNPQSFKNNKHLVVWNGPHAVYSYNGKYDEAFTGVGTDTGIEDLSVLETAHCASAFCPILGAYSVK